MRVNIRFFTTLRDAAGISEDTVDIEGDTVGDIIDTLLIKYGDRLKQEVFQPDGSIKPSVKVLLNESFVSSAALFSTLAKEEDTLSLLPAMFGG